MNVDALALSSGVTAAVQLASVRTGIDFNYFYSQAKTESGLNPDAAARTSSARGLYQFTGGTWLDTIRRHGTKHGLAWAAAAVTNGSAARDPAVKAAILDLRRDPVTSAHMAGAYAADNSAKLEAGLGRTATSTDLYMAHFLGAAGALRFLKAKAADPGATAALVSPAAARSNHSVFFAANGNARSLAAVYDRLAVKFSGNIVPPTGTILPVATATASAAHALLIAAIIPVAATRDAARLVYLQLAGLSA